MHHNQDTFNMATSVYKINIPSGSEIEKTTNGAYYYDTYKASVAINEKSALDIYLDMVKSTPEWVNSLMALRNKAVSMVGLKNLGHLGEIEQSKLGKNYKIGDRVGIFSVLFISDNEVILGESDKHLDVKLSIYKMSENKQNAIAISTVVHIHNLLGKLYMLFVTPLHKVIAPAMLNKIEFKANEV